MKTTGPILIAILAITAVLVAGGIPARGAATFIVNSTGDASDANTSNTACDTGNLNSGGQPECTLRAAIEQANSPNSSGLDTIQFNIPTTEPGYDGPGADAICAGNTDDEGDGFVNDGCPQVGVTAETGLQCTNQINDDSLDDSVVNDGCPDWATGTFIITPNTFLPFINDPVVIDGRTPQPQFVDKPVIQLNGSRAGNLADGLRITAGGSGSTVRGLIINRFGGLTGNGSDGIEIQGGGNNTIEGNFIGVDSTGILTDTNPLAAGQVYGNRGRGVFLNGSANNTIGGSRPGVSCVGATNPCNILAGGGRDDSAFSDAHGIEISGSGATGNTIKGNIIGLDIGEAESGPLCTVNLGFFLGSTSDDDADGVINDGCPANGPAVVGAIKDLGNRGDGVFINGVANNTIGGGASGEGNVITANNGNGVRISGGPEAGSACTNSTDDDGDGAVNDGCPTVGATAETGAQCLNNTNDDPGNDSVVNDGCPAVRVASGNQLEGNLIGTTSPGTSLPPPGSTRQSIGVLIDGAPSNLVGAAGGVPNVVSGNGTGIQIQGLGAAFNVVQGNYVGTNITGTSDLGNLSSGIVLGGATAGAANNTIGGTAAGAGNVVSGNDLHGIEINNSTSTGNLIRGNYIGTNAAGTAAIGNGFLGGNTTGRGVRINGSSGNTIGGTAAGRNVISGNVMFGVEIAGAAASGNLVQSNYIGTNAAGTGPVGNLAGGVIVSGAPNTIIGGTTADVRNVISGNGPANASGIVISGSGATGTVVQGNLIGTNFDGTAALANGGSGVLISNAPANAVGGTSGGATRNIISGNGLHGVEIDFAGGTGNLVLGNYIGVNVSGSAALGNGGDGVFISDAPGNAIGGTAAGAANVIAANGSMGVHVAGSASSGNFLRGNLIGTDAGGGVDLGNAQYGVFIDDAPNNTVGGTTASARNIISGNGTGVFIQTAGASGNAVRGNRIGTNAAGTAALGNDFDGVRIGGNATNNSVGGLGAGSGNTIAHNGSNGVVVDSGTGNSILSNSIFQNGALGIDLATVTDPANGVTQNDPQDADSGANNLQNYPVLSSANSSASSTTIVGTLNSTANTTFTLQFSASAACDNPSLHGEGETFLGSFSVTTNGSGVASFNQPVSFGGVGTLYITSTATDPGGSTSEFSTCVQATGVLGGPTPTPTPPPPPPNTPGYYHPVTPARILDTRFGPGPTGPVGAGGEITVDVTGVGTVPANASDVSAVVVNATVTGGTATSFLTVYPSGESRPLASNLNFAAGQTVPNLVTVKVGTDGNVKVYNANGQTHVIFDVVGWYGLPAGGSRFNPLAPSRILDTRTSPQGVPAGKVQSGSEITVTATGVGGVPPLASGVTAVVLNATVDAPTATSYLTVYPTGVTRPLASNLNFVKDQTVPNLVMVKVGATDGKIKVYNNNGQVHVIFDVVGWYGGATGDVFIPLTPTRILDTRTSPQGVPSGKVQSNAEITVAATGVGGVPWPGASSVIVNATVDQPTAASYLTIYPADASRPIASNLNFVGGQTVPNLVVVKVSEVDGKVKAYNANGQVHVIFDAVGYFGPEQ